jgi:hypothetical protein
VRPKEENIEKLVYDAVKRAHEEDRKKWGHESSDSRKGSGGIKDVPFSHIMGLRSDLDKKKVGDVAGQGIKNKKTIVFVTGPESSGNRFTVKLLKEAARCHGKSGHVQPLDHKRRGKQKKDWSTLDENVLINIHKNQPCAVIHRSFPHNNNFVDLTTMAKIARKNDFLPQVIVLVRLMPAVLDSQVKRKHVLNEQKARINTKRAYLEIFKDIMDDNLPYTIVVYEFLNDPDYVKWLFEEIGIEYDPSSVPEFKEQNEKHIKHEK